MYSHHTDLSECGRMVQEILEWFDRCYKCEAKWLPKYSLWFVFISRVDGAL